MTGEDRAVESRRAPLDELAAIRSLDAGLIRKATCLRIFCETGRCEVGRAFRRTQGVLVEMAGTTLWGQDDDGPIRTKTSCFWLEETASDEWDLGISFACRCATAQRHWLLTYRDIASAIEQRRKTFGVSRGRPG